MEQIYALISGGVVVNRIVADATFVSSISGSWDHIVRVDELEVQPNIGWLYDSETETFSEPT